MLQSEINHEYAVYLQILYFYKHLLSRQLYLVGFPILEMPADAISSE